MRIGGLTSLLQCVDEALSGHMWQQDQLCLSQGKPGAGVGVTDAGEGDGSVGSDVDQHSVHPADTQVSAACRMRGR